MQPSNQFLTWKRFVSAANIVVVLGVGTLASQTAWGAPGNPDPVFGVDGTVVLTRGGSVVGTQQPARQADGKWVVPIESNGLNGARNGRAGGIVRLNANGTPDSTFGYEGFVGLGRSTAVTFSGTDMLVAGQADGNDFDHVWIQKLDASGMPVSSFGTNGRTDIFRISPFVTGYAYQLMDGIGLAPDGSVFIAGQVRNAAGDGNLIAVAKFTSAGVLDSSFGTGGSVTFQPLATAGNFQMMRFHVLADGSMVIAGNNGEPGTTSFVARLTAAGSLDTSFATLGIYSIGSSSHCAAIVPDGTGFLVACSVNDNYNIIRLTSTGVLDAGFSSTTVDMGVEDVPVSIQRLPNNKVLVAGRGNARSAVALLNSSGGLDMSFNSSGYYVAPEGQSSLAKLPSWNGSSIDVLGLRAVPGSGEELTVSNLSLAGIRASFATHNPVQRSSFFRVKALPDGKLVAGGTSHVYVDGNVEDQDQPVFMRFNLDGTLDTSFGAGGVATGSFGPNMAFGAGMRDFILLASGDIVFTGDFNSVTAGNVGVGKLLAAGIVDTTFNAAGPNPGQNIKAIGAPFTRNLRVQSDGKIVVTGLSNAPSPVQFGVVRFNADGTVDNSYGVAGLARTTFASNSTPRYIDIDASGNVVVAGHQGNSQLRFARFTSAGVLDTSFGTGGMVSIPAPAGFILSLPNKVIVLPDGRLLTVFSGTVGGVGTIGLMRLTATGAFDTSFGNSGFTLLSVSNYVNSNTTAFDMAVAPNGRVVVVIQNVEDANSQVRTSVARFNPDGNVDASFGVGGVRHYAGASGVGQNLVGIDVFPNGAMAMAGSLGSQGASKLVVFKTVADPSAVLAISTMSLTSSANPSQVGQPVTFTATVTSSTGTPTGTVSFSTGTGPIVGCSAAVLATGTATCTTASLPSGTVMITAAYSGDAMRLATTSPVFMQIVNAAPAGPAKKNDLNGDGRADLLWRNESDGSVQGWLMNGLSATQVAGLLPPGGYTITHVADLDGNGKADTLIRHTDGTTIAWLHDGLNVVGQATLFSAGSGWSVKHAADLNGDGKADLIVENTNGTVVCWLMDGLTVIGTATFVPAGTGWSVSRVGDLNGDGKADLIWQNINGTVQAWLMNGLSATQTATFVGDGTGWSVKQVADMSGDGKADLVWQHTDGTVQAWVMDGTTVSQIASFVPAGTGWSPVLAGDLNGDGKADLFWQHTDGRSQTWLMNGLTVTAIAGFVGAGPWSATHLLDLNGDNKMDVLWKNADGTVQAWLMDGLTILQIASLAGPGAYVVVPPRPL